MRKRDSVASKLRDSVRQLRRYLDTPDHVERILVAKSDKIELDREELITKHHDYADKSGISIDDEEMRQFIEGKIDEAVDIVDEATSRIEELNSTSQLAIEHTKRTADTERVRLEIATMKLQSASCQRILEGIVNEINETIQTVDPTIDDAIKVESALVELENQEEELIKSWNDVRSKLTVDDAITQHVEDCEPVRHQISACRRAAKAFVAKIRGDDDDTASEHSVVAPRSSSSHVHKLAKMDPPKFSGDIRDFARFKSDFERIVMKEYDDETHQVYTMKSKCLEGDARNLVKNLQTLDDIWERLKDKYGDTNDIIDSVIREIEEVRIPSKNQDEAVIKFIEALERGVQDLTVIGKRQDIACPYTVKLIEKKLPRRLLSKWLDEDEKDDSEDRFESMLQFLKKERKRTEKILQQVKDREKEKERSRDNPNRRDPGRNGGRGIAAAAQQQGQGEVRNNCLIHPRAAHFTRKCSEFKRKSVEERGQLVKDLNACKLCLTITHIGEPCPREPDWNPCDVGECNEMHSRLLHGAPALLTMHIQQQQVTVASKSCKKEARTLLLMQDIPSPKGKVFTFWDNGSSISLVSRQYARRNKLRGVKVSYDLVTVNNVVTPQHTMLYDIQLIDRNGNINIIVAYEIEEICEETAFFDSKVTDLFKDVKADDVKRPRRKVDLLVGMNKIKLHPQLSDTNDDLALFTSLFGTGKVLGGQHASIQGADKTNAFAKLVAYGGMRNIRVESPIQCIDFFTAESLGVSAPRTCNNCNNCEQCRFAVSELSKIERKELGIIKNNLTLDPVKQKWTTTYPYKVDPSVLKNNHAQALAILLRLEKRLSKDDAASDCFRKQFQDFIDRGVFKLLSQEEISEYTGPIFYITTHEVFKEDSPSTPVRIVSNASLQFEGVSYNDILMKGPNNLNDLFAILLRFRVHLVALVGDISKMYHSVLTTEKERHLRRVLWRDMKLDEEPKIYGTETVAFGDRPAAAITTVAIKETAEIYAHIDEVAAQKIKEDMYVDDIVTGSTNVDKVETLKVNIKAILEKGGFHIKGFVMSGDTSEDLLSLLGTGEIGRVLGVGYDPTKDEFAVKVRINFSKKFKGARTGPDLQRDEIPAHVQEKFTRRILLAITNSIYDVYGFFVPLTIQLKIIVRETYKKELNLRWDDDIPSHLKQKAIEVLLLIKDAEQLRFPRCISRVDSVGDPTLVVFNDGSPLAMCAVAYIRWSLSSGEFTSQFVLAKARVTPLERMTIPRSEMQSGVLGVRISKSIEKSCGLKFEDVVHISDSECTIATIAKDSTALKEFMGNRVAEITRNTEPTQWFHVKSANNISDLGTRANATIEDITHDSEWQTGPTWLKLDKNQWPVSQDIGSEHIPQEELINSKLCSLATSIPPLIDISQWRMRTYTLLMQSTARVYAAFDKKSFHSPSVTPSALEKAESYWIKQSMVLTSEALEKGNLRSLRPRVDENGIIVLSSRAQEGIKMHYNRDRFPILTTRDPLAFLWLKHVHDEDHSGRTKTIAMSRGRFWIVRAGRLFEKVKSMCYRCKLLEKELAMQQMSALPEHRLAIAPVFNTTSIDLFGPLTIKDMVKKRTTMKVWGFVASCTATRCLHIDITESYSTDAILQTLRKFKLLRRSPTEIISDQGSQLKAAAKDLTKDWDWSVVSDWVGKKGMKWTIVPAEGQHQNGLSESLIKSVKRSIKHVIGDNVLSFSELQLAFFEIADIINSRPLGIKPGSDSDDLTPITPNGLLYGEQSNEVPQGPFQHKVSIARRFLYVQSLIDDWWRKWSDLVLPSLVPCYKWQQKHRNVKLGDVCLIRYKKVIRSTYRLGRVCEVKTGNDGLVRSVRLKYKLPNETAFRYVDRAIHGIVVIVPLEEQEK